MLTSVLTGIVAVPAIVGTTEAIRQGQRQNAREQYRAQKSHLVTHLRERNIYSERFDGARVILRDDGKLYVDTNRRGTIASPQSGGGREEKLGHPFTGYFLPHPHNQSRWKGAGWKGEGLVSTISDDPPVLNWIYVDNETHEMRFGTRAQSEGQRLGPWDVSPGPEKRVTFEGWEGFIAVEEHPEEPDERKRALWALYFDVEDDGLRSEGRVGSTGRRMLYVTLTRQEMVVTREMAEDERQERVQRREEVAKRNAERRGIEYGGDSTAAQSGGANGQEHTDNGNSVNGNGQAEDDDVYTHVSEEIDE